MVITKTNKIIAKKMTMKNTSTEQLHKIMKKKKRLKNASNASSSVLTTKLSLHLM